MADLCKSRCLLSICPSQFFVVVTFFTFCSEVPFVGNFGGGYNSIAWNTTPVTLRSYNCTWNMRPHWSFWIPIKIAWYFPQDIWALKKFLKFFFPDDAFFCASEDSLHIRCLEASPFTQKGARRVTWSPEAVSPCPVWGQPVHRFAPAALHQYFQD